VNAGQRGSENALMMKRTCEFTGPAPVALLLNSSDGKRPVSIFFAHITLFLKDTYESPEYFSLTHSGNFIRLLCACRALEITFHRLVNQGGKCILPDPGGKIRVQMSKSPGLLRDPPSAAENSFSIPHPQELNHFERIKRFL
jgi:hypothetical protein